MKLLAIVCISIFGAYQAHADLTSAQVRSFEGRYAFDIFKVKDFAKLAQSTMLATSTAPTAATKTAALADLNLSMAVTGPSALLDGRFLVVSGCQAHNCGGGNRALVIVDAQNPAAALVVRKNVTALEVGAPDKEAAALLPNGEWTVSFGFDIRGFPASVQQAISDL